jgi:hypothetical protein
MKENITNPVGVRTYSPDEEVARKAPAIICAVASRTLRLRAKLDLLRKSNQNQFSLHDIEDLVRDYISVLPFERELLSSDIVKVDEVLREFVI